MSIMLEPRRIRLHWFDGFVVTCVRDKLSGATIRLVAEGSNHGAELREGPEVMGGSHRFPFVIRLPQPFSRLVRRRRTR
jgi:hypothetical protein